MSLGRLSATLIILVAVFLMPWWGIVLATLVLIVWFAPYYEAVFIGVILDALYTLRSTSDVFSLGFLFTFVFVAALFMSLYMKDKIRLDL